MRVLVCGGREYADRDNIWRVLAALAKQGPISVIIDGMAPGADTIGHDWARSAGVRSERYPAEWAKYGRAAGPIRNRRMLEEGKPDLVLAFHPDLTKSKGTKDMMRQAEKAGVEVRHYR